MATKLFNSIKPKSLTSTRSLGLTTHQEGQANTFDWRVFFQNKDRIISPWHNIPLIADTNRSKLFNLVVEIPQQTTAKIEIATKERHNPLKQDVKKGKLRHYAFEPIFNYGCLPQTWEDPNEKHPDTQCIGDNDPIDVVDLTEAIPRIGDVYVVKAVGVLGLIDEGESDWKVLTIAANHPLADKIRDLDDLQKHFGERVKRIREWFRTYKIPDGKPPNEFAFEGKVKSEEYALSIIMETHSHWQRLISGKILNHDLAIEQDDSLTN